MLVGLYVSTDEKVSNDLVAMLKEKFQGIEFITLRDLSQDLNMATLAKGSFDKVIVYVSAFNGFRTDRIIEELGALKSYKELRAKNVNIQVVDRINPRTNNGILDMAYRKFFGSFVDCQYYLKKDFTGSTLVELIRGVDINDDYFENLGRHKDVNKRMVNALSAENKVTNEYSVIKSDQEKKESAGTEEVKKSVKSESKVEVEKVEDAIKVGDNGKIDNTDKVESNKKSPEKSKPTRKGFSLFGRKKVFKVVEPDLSKMETVANSESKDELVVNNSDVEEKLAKEEVAFNNERESFVEEVPDEEVSDFLYGDVESKVIKNKSVEKVYESKYKHVESAVSRNPEVVTKEEIQMEYRDVNESSNAFGMTNSFDIPTELSSNEALMKKQLELKELELKARMLEAQAQIKNTELESAQRNSLVSPVRMSEERVTGYINSNRGRSRVILVTGLDSSGKTTAAKLIGEILKDLAFTIDVDLDFDGRTLSDTFSRLDESELTRLGVFRSLRDLSKIEQFTVPVDGNLDVLGTFSQLSEAEENSLEKRLDTSLIQPMLRKISNSGIYGFVIVDCPLEILKQATELLDLADYVVWTCKGSRHGIKSMINELGKDFYDEFFLNKLTIVLNGEHNQQNVWKRFFNTASMWSDDIADSLGAIIPYIEDYDNYFWNDISGLELNDFKTNILEVLELV